MHFIDLDLARRVEMAEARAGRECAEACHRLHPEFTVDVQEIAGGIAVFAGVDSPVTQAIGVGLHGTVSDAELDALGEFFHSRKAPASIELCPLVEMSLYEKFAARNYRLLEVSNVLLLDDLKAARIEDKLPPGVTIRVATLDESKLWTITVAQGFAEHFPVTQAMLDLMEGFYYRSTACCYLAFADGDIAGWRCRLRRPRRLRPVRRKHAARIPPPRRAIGATGRSPCVGARKGLRHRRQHHPTRQHLAPEHRTQRLSRCLHAHKADPSAFVVTASWRSTVVKQRSPGLCLGQFRFAELALAVL